MRYFGMKLKSGPTIFCEVHDRKDDKYVISKPLIYDQRVHDEGNISIAFVPFNAYTNSPIHKIDVDEVYMADPLSNKFIRMYGEAVMNFDITYVKMDYYDRFTGNINEDYPQLVEMIDKCKKIGEKYAEIFEGISQPDFSELEQKLAENRPTIN